MAKSSNVQARKLQLPLRCRTTRIHAAGRARRTQRATLGELIAAAYDAIGPSATAEDVARFLGAAGLAPRVVVG